MFQFIYIFITYNSVKINYVTTELDCNESALWFFNIFCVSIYYEIKFVAYGQNQESVRYLLLGYWQIWAQVNQNFHCNDITASTWLQGDTNGWGPYLGLGWLWDSSKTHVNLGEWGGERLAIISCHAVFNITLYSRVRDLNWISTKIV